MQITTYIISGILAGTFSGLFGVGGGMILIPIFVAFFGLTQHQAQGTSLAVLLPPVFLLAVMRYYTEGHVKVQMAMYVVLGFVLGTVLGSNLAQQIPGGILKKSFGCLLILVGLRMIFKS